MKALGAFTFIAILLVVFVFALAISNNFPYSPNEATTGGTGGFCSDSDNGNNIYVQGRCVSSQNTGTDFCNSDGTLTEYYCSRSKGNPQCLSSTVICPTGYGCMNGACVRGVNGGIFTTTTTSTTTSSTATTTTSPTAQLPYTQSEKGLHISSASNFLSGKYPQPTFFRI